MPVDESIVEKEFSYDIKLSTPPKPGHSLWLCHEVSGEIWFKKQLEFVNQVARGSLIEGGHPPAGAFNMVVIELTEEGQAEVEEWFRQGQAGKGYPGFATIQGAKVAEVRLILGK